MKNIFFGFIGNITKMDNLKKIKQVKSEKNRGKNRVIYGFWDQ